METIIDNPETITFNIGNTYLKDWLQRIKELYESKYPDYSITYEEIILIAISELHTKTIVVSNTDWDKEINEIIERNNPNGLGSLDRILETKEE